MNCILGAGVTGLAAAWASGLPVYEAAGWPGGICSSYYLRPGSEKHLRCAPEDGEAYRFEIGGGHWIFGGDPLVLYFIKSLTGTKSYVRRSAVYFPDRELFVPYPLQNHLRHLGKRVAAQALEEMVVGLHSRDDARTMAGWLLSTFGPTLYELFFEPFHERYTAGLFRDVAPQDSYKTPINMALVIEGILGNSPEVGYNATFIYPSDGLNRLVELMAARCMVQYGRRVVRIDVEAKEIYFEDGSAVRYDKVLCTLPLNRVMAMTGLDVGERPDPATSVLVVNIGAVKGSRCPSQHWVYVPKSRVGFHRVGFYSNVDASFLPASARDRRDRVSIYVEKAYRQGARPADADIDGVCQATVNELQEWEWIGETEVVDATWVEVAYTWSWPNSRWRPKALAALEAAGIYQVGRYGRWVFQGIADSIREGLAAGAAFRPVTGAQVRGRVGE
jgi:protoporphyrinogen oxidase